MEIRRLSGDEIYDAATMATDVFQVETGSWTQGYLISEEEAGPGVVWGVYDHGRLVGSCVAPSQPVWFGEKQILGGYVEKVCTWEADRRHGYAGELMRSVLRNARERGVLITYLWPFSYRYYRKFGWELTADRIRLSLSREHALQFDSWGTIEEVTVGQVDVLEGLWAEFAQKYNGSSVRSARCWIRLMAKHYGALPAPSAPLYGGAHGSLGCWLDGELMGYVRWKRVPEDKEELEIIELVCRSGEVEKALLRAAAEREPQAKTVTWDSPMDRFGHLLRGEARDFTRKIEAGAMARITDPEAFLRTVHWSDGAKGALKLTIHDPVFGMQQFCLALEGGEIQPVQSAKIELACDVQTLAQIASGYLKAEKACELGLIDSAQVEGARFLEMASGNRISYRSPQEGG